MQEPYNNTPPVAQENIFSDAFDMEPYEKNMKNARIWLYVVAGLQFLMGIYEYASKEDKMIGGIAFGIDAFIALVFVALALWSKKAPVIAFTTALVLYLVFVLGFIFLDSSNVARGVLVKILVVVALFKANRDARKYVEIKNSINGRENL